MRTLLTASLLATLLASLAAAQTVVSSFPVAPAGSAFVGGVEYDCQSNIVWVVDETSDLISAYDNMGNLLRQYPAPTSPGTVQPIGCGTDPATGRLWIGDEGEIVYEFDPVLGVPTGVFWSTTPTVSDVSGIAVDPQNGHIYVSQDSGTPRLIAEFDQAGNPIQTIDITASGSTDPDGLAYDINSGTWYLGDDTADTIYQVDNTGAALNTWSLAGLGISPEGLGVDPVNGFLYVGDGFVTRSVYIVAGIVPAGGLCVPGTPVFNIAVSTSGAADMVLTVNGVPPTTVEGWTFFTLDTSTPVNAGPIFGITPDLNTLAILSLAPVASAGNPLHWTWPATGLFPNAPFGAPPGAFSAFIGTSWDFIGLAIDAAFAFTPTFNVQRVTW